MDQPSPLVLNTGIIINAYQNEELLWNVDANVTEEAKELAWRRLADLLGYKSAGNLLTDHYFYALR